jgi:hypothetical protein
MARLTLLIALSFLAAGSALAQSWQAPDPQFRRFGFLTVACNDDSHGGVCLGLACPEGQLQLVSAAGGGGPMDGPTITMGERRAQATFVWDDVGINVLGIAASRAPVDRATVEAMAATPRVTLRAGSGNSALVHRFATRNLAREWERVARSCSR